jgi:hypothetical protein
VKTEPTAPSGGAPDLRVTGATEERTRISEIDSLWAQHELPANVRNELVNSGATIEPRAAKRWSCFVSA